MRAMNVVNELAASENHNASKEVLHLKVDFTQKIICIIDFRQVFKKSPMSWKLQNNN